MSKFSVAQGLLAQVEFNMATMRTLLAIIDATPGAGEKEEVREALLDLSVKNSAVLEQVKTVIADNKPVQNDGR